LLPRTTSEPLQPDQKLRRRLSTRGELALAVLPTGTILLVMAFIEVLSTQRLLFASLASSAFLIYLDPHHASNGVRTLVLAQVSAALNSARLFAYLAVLASSGCAGHGVPHVAPDESLPHTSWEIRSGSEGDPDFICGSARPGQPCVLEAMTEKSRTLATVQLFVHAAAQRTSYVGFMRASFFEGEVGGRLGEVNATVNPGSRPVATTVVGRVTSKPGSYTLTISVDAAQGGGANPVHISDEVPVVVR